MSLEGPSKKPPLVVDPANIPDAMTLKVLFEDATLNQDELKELMEHMGISGSVISNVLMCWSYTYSNIPKQGNMAGALQKVLQFLYEFRNEFIGIRNSGQSFRMLFGFYKKSDSGRMKNQNDVLEQMRQSSARLAAATTDFTGASLTDSAAHKLPPKGSFSGDTHHKGSLKTADLEAFMAAQGASTAPTPLANLDPELAAETQAVHDKLDKTIADMKAASESSTLFNVKDVTGLSADDVKKLDFE